MMFTDNHLCPIIKLHGEHFILSSKVGLGTDVSLIDEAAAANLDLQYSTTWNENLHTVLVQLNKDWSSD